MVVSSAETDFVGDFRRCHQSFTYCMLLNVRVINGKVTSVGTETTLQHFHHVFVS